jgi:hypothetical protein
MNDSGHSGLQTAEDFFDDQSLAYRPSGPDLISDDDIDYPAMAINTHPDKPGGRIVFSTADYPSEEEAMAAMEAFLMGDTEEDGDALSAEG